MKKFVFTTGIVLVGLIVIAVFGRSTSSSGAQSSGQTGVFGFNKPVSNEDFWKIFRTGLSDGFKEPEKKISSQDALAIVSAMNNITDAFDRDYSFTRLDRPLFMSKLTMFLENPKNQPLLQQFLQLLKDNIAGFPEQFSNVAASMEESINNKNAEQFWAIHSALEHYFRGLPIKPLVRITTGWRATVNNIKDAITSRARRVYDYLFSKKSTLTMHTIRFDEVTGKYVTEEKAVEI